MQSDLATVAQQLLQLASRLGVDYLFINLGSDHPAFVEALARLTERGEDMPRVIACPHEMTALSAAHGYAMITRRPQIVLVHVDVGTQNLGCSVHNAGRGRIPAIIIAGLSPLTDQGERVGKRNEFIHHIQDTPRQHEIVGQYVKWAYELRAAETIDAVLLRGVQLATTMPEGPVYLTGAREIWEKRVPASREIPAHWPAATLGALSPAAAAELHQALRQAQRPLVLTTYLGRQTQAVARLVALSERLGFGVCELGPQYLSFPGEHPHHLGYRRNELIAEADLILMIDVDVPWIASKVQPAEGARLFHIDLDPVKQGLGFWHYPAQRSYQADSLKALDQLLAVSDEVPAEARRARVEWLAAAKQRQTHAGQRAAGAEISAEELTLAVRELVNERTVIVFEAPSNTELVPSLLKLNRPGSYFASGGSGLGWGINAAIGAKLADPEAEVIALIGDGCFMFGVPSSAYWVSGAYQAPHLTVIYNNGGWNSPKLSTLGVHPKGDAKRNDTYWVTVGRGARLADIAAATGGAVAYRVSERRTLKETLADALQTVRAGKSAVVDVSIAPVSAQILN
ncbi:MAG TPA: thiamine pyrophosphate-requiring protein [Rhodocyclaceae bacterium]|nr:thiamine pyrophosphate-requiring protein [Rhodocyclaceae bacterium]